MSEHPRSQEATSLEEYQRLLALLDERRFEEAQARGRLLLENPETGDLTRAKTHNLLCWTFIEGLKRPASEAVLHGEESVRIAMALGERSLYIQALCNLAGAQYQVGEYEAASRSYGECRDLLLRNPALLPHGAVIAGQGLAQIELVQGRPDRALLLLDEAAELCRAQDTPALGAEIQRRRAIALLKLEQPDLAAQALAQVDESVFTSGPRSLWWKTHYRFTAARVEMERGHWVSARPLIVGTMALARELGDYPVLAECTCLLALLEQAEGRRDAPRRARTALTLAIHSGRRDVVEDIRSRLGGLLSAGI